MSRRSKNRQRLLLPLALGSVALVLALSAGRIESADTLLPLTPPPRSVPTLAVPGEPSVAFAVTEIPEPFTLRRGQTFDEVLEELGLESAERHAAVSALSEHVEVRRIRAGETGLAWFDDRDELLRLRLRQQNRGWAELTRDSEGWRSSWRELVRSVEVRRTRGELESALSSALKESGGHPNLDLRMSRVLQWDLDFNRDLRRGDRFEVLWEDVTLDGEPAGPGEILALVYENRGRRLEAYRFGDGYYDPEGQPLRKLFLRAPLPFSRVTSKFSKRRFHPVLKTHRPHYGVDYGAKTGTPVQVTASGTVSFVGRTDAAGKMVKVRHPNGYLTAYLHLSGFARGLHKGAAVTQGEVIGYVGSTGWATGPHLDYRVQKQGRWIDPLQIESTPAEPIAEADLEEFLAQRDTLRARLASS